MFLDNLKIAQKIALTFAAVIGVIVAMGAVIFINVGAIDNARREYSHVAESIRVTEQARTAMMGQIASYRGYLVTGDLAFIEEVDAHRARFKAHLNAVREDNAGAAEVIRLADQAETAVDGWYVNIVEVGRALWRDPATRQQAADMIGRDGPSPAYLGAAEESMRGLIELKQAKLAAEAREQAAAGRMALSVLAGGILLAALLAAGLGLLVSTLIARPVVHMTGAMRRLAEGDKTVQAPGLGRKDEFGQMAAAVAAFKDAALAHERLEGEASAQRRQTEEDRARVEADKAREAEADRVAFEALAHGLAALADGDLTHRITQPLGPKAERLKTDFNDAVERLRAAMGVVAVNVSAIRTGAGEISQAADDLSHRTEQQAASLEETAAALDQITATVRRTASGANQASDVVQAARGDAQKSGEVVRDAVQAMTAIEQSSTQIGQIIGVIDEIAFQTNLLALNAGVEAARAGDAGRGFAVVAQEVRALAQRSAEAAKEIKALISSSGTQVGAGVRLVGQTGEALNLIVDRVVEIDGLVSEIAASAQEQATGLQQVNTAVNQMDQVTQQNAAMVEQSTAASRQLAQEADALNQSVARFRIGETAAAAPARTAPEAPARRSPVQRTVTALKAMGAGGAARKLEAAALEDGWEEF